MWTAKDGSCEMSFSDFVDEVKAFGVAFFSKMDQQIDLTLAKEWGAVKI